MTKFTDIVVGCGVSAMTCAILLARTGRRVLILEKSPMTAPTIRGFKRGGCYFDTGFHYGSMMEEGGLMRRLFNDLGLEGIETVETAGDISDWLICGDKSFKFPKGLDRLGSKLVEAFPPERESIEDFISKNKYLLEGMSKDIQGLLSFDNPFRNEDASLLKDYLDSSFKDQFLKAILSIHSILYGSFSTETSVAYHCMVTSGYLDGSRLLRDGGEVIANAMEDQLAKYGVQILTNTELSEICIDNKKVTSVKLTDGREFECDNCIYTPHIKTLFDKVSPENFRPVYRSRILEKQDTPSAFVVYCKSDKPGRVLDCNSLILSEDFTPDFSLMDRPIEDRLKFITQSYSSNYDDGISIIVPALFSEVEPWQDSAIGSRPAEYIEWKRQTAKKIVASAQKCYNGLGRLEILDAATPLTFRDYMNTPTGALYGTKHRYDEMPILPRTKTAGLYLAGQSLLSAGVLGAMTSAYLCVGMITGEKFMESE